MSDDNRFLIGDKAEKLYFDILDKTTNRKKYPVKFRRVADKLQEVSINIYTSVVGANEITPNSESRKQYRFDFQTEAVASCKILNSLIKYCLHSKLISSATAEKWSNAATEVKKMTLAWRKF